MQVLTEFDHEIRKLEPNPFVLRQDLGQLAAYLIKIGSDVNIVTDRAKRHRLIKHRMLVIPSIDSLVRKYGLNWNYNSSFRSGNNRTLIQLASHYPRIFIYEAAQLSPGSYEERRFWWCANNRDFYEKYKSHELAPSRLLADVLSQVLTFRDQKLIVINALHLSIKHSEQRVFLDWYRKNKVLVMRRIQVNELGKRNPREKEELRKMFKIEEAEDELEEINVDYFLEWWNLTGLRRPYTT